MCSVDTDYTAFFVIHSIVITPFILSCSSLSLLRLILHFHLLFYATDVDLSRKQLKSSRHDES